MTFFIFANNINTALSAAVTSSQTTVTLASTEGLPGSIPSGSVLVVTLNDQATRSNFEVLHATAVAGATLTVVRAQEGTAALTWGVGDYAYSAPTAGQMGGFLQSTPPGCLLNVQTFDLAGTYTYTETPGTGWVIVEVQAAGGGSGCAAATGVSDVSVGGSGSAGNYGKSQLLSGFSGASIVVGAAGAGGTSGSVNGGAGGASSFGALTAAGGIGGGQGASLPFGAATVFQAAAAPATAAGFNILNVTGQGGVTYFIMTNQNVVSAPGGASFFGTGAPAQSVGFPGASAVNYGSGGSGGANGASGSLRSGGAGAGGVVFVWEFS